MSSGFRNECILFVPSTDSDVKSSHALPGAMRLMLVIAGMIALLSVSARAACTAPSAGGVAVCSPATGTSTVNPVHYVAAASSPSCAAGISLMSIWNSAGKELYSVGGSKLDTFLPMGAGSQNNVVKATDKCGTTRQTSVSVSVRGTAVTTYQYNTQRTGANLYETILTPANVNESRFGKRFSCAVDSYIYGQPLFMPGLSIAGATHNVVFVGTENNSVYAFDADGKTCTPLWHTSIGPPVPCSANSPASGTNCNSVLGTSTVGITSTMFIDPTLGAHGAIYVEGRTAPGGVAPFHHQLHKLDLTTGKEMSDSPVTISASIAGNACDNVNGTITFNSATQQNRSALLYANGALYIGFASINDAPRCPNAAFHGWILGYNASDIQQRVSVFNTSRNVSGNGSGPGAFGGIWGGALAASLSNDVYAATGNGPFNATASVADWGNTYLRLAASGNTLKVLDYFTPAALFNTSDLDLGTNTGIVLVVPGPTPHELIGGGKTGTLYVVNRDKMGKYESSSDQIIQELPSAVGVHTSSSPTCGSTGDDCDYSSPAYWNSHIYVSGVNDHVKEFALTNGKLSGPSSMGAQIFGFPGGTATVSANGNNNGIVWVVEPGKAVLHAYDATNLANELYNSSQNSARDALGSFVKFAPATVVNGKVYVGTKNHLVGYGLLP
jgi:hypothetical protein